MRKPLPLAAIAAACLLAGAVAAHAQYDDPGPDPQPGGSCQSGDIQINAQSVGGTHTFSPSDKTIQAGQTVCFKNATGIPHNVHADGVFQCAGACDSNPSSPSSPAGEPSSSWVTRISFTNAATVNYHCDIHGSMGMTGRIVVQGAPAGSPGALSFTTGSFSVGEGTANATITARRTGGDDGAVSVHYATANGTATAGSDYTAKSGTLSWADNDDNNTSFTIPITNDAAAEANETVLLALSSPTGGATLGSPSSATLTINDNDSPPGPTAPAAPGNLAANPISTSEIRLTWNDNANNETQFLIERAPLGGSFAQIGTAPANSTEFTAGGLTSATGYQFRVRAANGTGNSAYSNVAEASTDATPGPCVATGGAVCINNDRFKVEVDWRNATGSGQGTGVDLPFAPDSGVVYFFSPDNLELLIKVLNACPLNNRYWVFFAATTNVEFTLTVTDTQSGRTKVYFNPLNRSAPPVQDVEAFATCP
jgi:plastocyanin